MTSWMMMSFQDSCSFTMMELSLFHDYMLSILMGIVVMITYILFYIIFNKNFYKNLSESTKIEIIWSVVPVFILIMLVMPSMKVLYLMEDIKTPSLNFKIVAHQWYWSYIVPFFKSYFYKTNSKEYFFHEFDSIMENEKMPRLLNCDKSLIIPYKTNSRLLLFSTDVIHSFSMPSMGLKVDALPGRINQLFVNPSRMGMFFGQCSEICGANHSFMPISMKVVDMKTYDNITKNFLLENISENFTNIKKIMLLSYSL
uniref:Cytochrome c oxidase subunit 2 n=2 Tax=Sarcoptes scabiei TaxID=52283 RepID=A0A347ZN89_SARSC|nr:cytochrome c oxidase subunit 2 [Sarcoptes scabiei]